MNNKSAHFDTERSRSTQCKQAGIAPLAIIVIVGLVVGGAVFLSRGASNKPAPQQPATQQQPQSSQSGQQVEAGWETYKSQQYGYTVKIPKGWKVTDTPSETSREISIVHPGAQSLVMITALKDEKLKDINYLKDSIKAFKEKLEKDPATLQLAKFEDKVEGNTGGFIAIGEEKREGVNWYFEQRGLLSTNGRVLLFHGAAQSNVYKEYKDIITEIIKSFSLE